MNVRPLFIAGLFCLFVYEIFNAMSEILKIQLYRIKIKITLLYEERKHISLYNKLNICRCEIL
jgi:hypothetical protein